MNLLLKEIGHRKKYIMKYIRYPWLGNYNVFKDDKNGIIYVYADIFIYGSVASESIAINISSDIRTAWNRPRAKISIKNRTYHVRFKIRGYYTTSPLNWITNNKDFKKVFIRVETKTDHKYGGISYVDKNPDKYGGNSGFFNLNNIIGVASTTEAHELGHAWGLWPNTKDGHPGSTVKGQPGIMYGRGTLVDSKFQYDIKAKRGERGGTLNPEKRLVLTSDINKLNLQSLSYDIKGRAYLGSLTNKLH